MTPRSRRIVAWAAVAAWAVLIFALSAKDATYYQHDEGLVAMVRTWLAQMLSGLAGHPVDPSPIGHFTEYLVFGALLWHALSMHLDGRSTIAATVGIAALYAITDEFHQLYVPGRSCDPADWLVDVTAALVAATILHAIFRSSRRRA